MLIKLFPVLEPFPPNFDLFIYIYNELWKFDSSQALSRKGPREQRGDDLRGLLEGRYKILYSSKCGGAWGARGAEILKDRKVCLSR